MNVSGIIYKTTNLINGKIYVGIHTKGSESYLGSGVYLRRAIARCGSNNFHRETIATFSSHREAQILERKYILQLNSKSPNGYNLTDGGDGLINPCQEVRDRIGARSRGRAAWNKGRPCSQETKSRLRVALCGRPAHNKGKPMSEEQKNKLRIARLGVPNSPETRMKISARMRGRIFTPEWKARISLAKMGNSSNRGRSWSPSRRAAYEKGLR